MSQGIIFQDITQTVGNTPTVKLNHVVEADDVNVFVKLEFFNPTSSVKDRIAVSMVNDAEAKGTLKPGGLIVEPTSGNTGLGLAVVAAARGYKLVITMPESMSLERRQILKHLGAEVILTPAEDGMKGAIEKATKIVKTTPGSFMPSQFDNPSNPKIHSETTALEIIRDTGGKIDFFVSGVGTGGTLTGCARALKKEIPSIKIIAVEPASSAVISGNGSGKHAIQGIGAGFIPENLDTSLIDETIIISDIVAIETARKLAKKEGIFCGISSGAAAAAALKLASKDENKGKNIIAILPDTGERYISTTLFVS